MLPFFLQALVVGGITPNSENKSKVYNEEEYCTTKDASEILHLSEYTVRKKIRDGELNADVIPGKTGYRIKKSDLVAYRARKQKKGTSINVAKNTISVAFTDVVNKITELSRNQSEFKLDSNLFKDFIDGKKQDLRSLTLRKQKLDLQNDDSSECNQKKIDLDIAISDLEAEIKAYEFVFNAVQNKRSGS